MAEEQKKVESKKKNKPEEFLEKILECLKSYTSEAKKLQELEEEEGKTWNFEERSKYQFPGSKKPYEFENIKNINNEINNQVIDNDFLSSALPSAPPPGQLLSESGGGAVLFKNLECAILPFDFFLSFSPLNLSFLERMLSVGDTWRRIWLAALSESPKPRRCLAQTHTPAAIFSTTIPVFDKGRCF